MAYYNNKQTNKQMTNTEAKTQTIAGVKVTEGYARNFKVVNAVIVIAINAFVMSNGGWSQAFQGGVQNDAAQVTYTK